MEVHKENSDVRRRVEQSSNLTGEQRVDAGIRQSELAIRVVEDGLRDRHPDADERTIASLLSDRLRLMKRVQGRKVSGA